MLNLLYRKPVLTAYDVEKELGVSTPTANVLIRKLQRLWVCWWKSPNSNEAVPMHLIVTLGYF